MDDWQLRALESWAGSDGPSPRYLDLQDRLPMCFHLCVSIIIPVTVKIATQPCDAIPVARQSLHIKVDPPVATRSH